MVTYLSPAGRRLVGISLIFDEASFPMSLRIFSAGDIGESLRVVQRSNIFDERRSTVGFLCHVLCFG